MTQPRPRRSTTGSAAPCADRRAPAAVVAVLALLLGVLGAAAATATPAAAAGSCTGPIAGDQVRVVIVVDPGDSGPRGPTLHLPGRRRRHRRLQDPRPAGLGAGAALTPVRRQRSPVRPRRLPGHRLPGQQRWLVRVLGLLQRGGRQLGLRARQPVRPADGRRRDHGMALHRGLAGRCRAHAADQPDRRAVPAADPGHDGSAARPAPTAPPASGGSPAGGIAGATGQRPAAGPGATVAGPAAPDAAAADAAASPDDAVTEPTTTTAPAPADGSDGPGATGGEELAAAPASSSGSDLGRWLGVAVAVSAVGALGVGAVVRTRSRARTVSDRRRSARPRRLLHPGAWWLWAGGLAVVALRTTNPLLLFLVLAVVAFVVANRRSEAPWAMSFAGYLKLGLVVIAIRMIFPIFFGNRLPGTELFTIPSVTLPGWAAGVSIGGPVTVEMLVGGVLPGAQAGRGHRLRRRRQHACAARTGCCGPSPTPCTRPGWP